MTVISLEMLRSIVPWDVVNYCDALRADGSAWPQNYWSNTSSNEAVKKFIQNADVGTTKSEIEKLVAGEIIKKKSIRN